MVQDGAGKYMIIFHIPASSKGYLYITSIRACPKTTRGFERSTLRLLGARSALSAPHIRFGARVLSHIYLDHPGPGCRVVQPGHPGPEWSWWPCESHTNWSKLLNFHLPTTQKANVHPDRPGGRGMVWEISQKVRSSSDPQIRVEDVVHMALQTPPSTVLVS